MIEFPSTTRVDRVLPKEAFYKNMTLNGKQRQRFVSDITRITVGYSLTAESLRLDTGRETDEIVILEIELKTRQYASSLFEIVARQNPHRIVFIPKFEGEIQVAVYHKRLYHTPWNDAENAVLTLRDGNLDEVWYGFVEQVVFYGETLSKEALCASAIDERLARQTQHEILQKEIERLEYKVEHEIQRRRKFDLYTLLQRKKEELEEASHDQKDQ